MIVPYFAESDRWMISGQKTAHALSKEHQVTVLTTGREPGVRQLGPNLTVHRLKDIFLPDPINYSLIPGLFKAVRSIVKSQKPNICLINKHMFQTAWTVWTVKRLGVPVLVQTDTFPGISWFPRRKFVRLVMWLYARLIGVPILRAADKVILLHEGLVATAKQLGLNYQVIHNGIDLDHLATLKAPRDLVKPKDEVWVGYVGRLESIKGWYDLAAVAKELADQYPKVRWLFVGQNKVASTRINAEFNHPNLIFLGQRTDALGIYQLLDVFVLPSYSEGLPNALMEAMASGRCCLSSAVGGVKYLLKDEQSGLLFQPGNRQQLTKQLKRVLSDTQLRAKLGSQARKTIEQDYNLSKTTDQLNQLLAEYVS